VVKAISTSRRSFTSDSLTVSGTLDPLRLKSTRSPHQAHDLPLPDSVLRLEITKSGRRGRSPCATSSYRALSERPGAREGRMWRDRNLRKAFETAAAAAGLDDFRFHDLRHSFASSFMMRGGSVVAARDPRPREHNDDAAVQPPVGPPTCAARWSGPRCGTAQRQHKTVESTANAPQLRDAPVAQLDRAPDF